MNGWPWLNWLLYLVIGAEAYVFSRYVLRLWRSLQNTGGLEYGTLPSREENPEMNWPDVGPSVSQEVEDAFGRIRNRRSRTPEQTEADMRAALRERERTRHDAVPGFDCRLKRALGFCQDPECPEYAKGVFLLSHGPQFFCPRCNREGWIQQERAAYTSVSDIFKEVRVEYNFDPYEMRYREVAIVRNEALAGTHNAYTLFSPLIKTEKRAMKTAESLLANLNSMRGLEDISSGRIPRTTEFILDICKPAKEYAQSLKELDSMLESSTLRLSGK